jgi:hypothetical protein
MIEFIGLVTTIHKWLSDTLPSSSYWTIHGNYSVFQLYSVVLLQFWSELRLAVPSYNSSARTPPKTPSSVVNNTCLLVRYLTMMSYCWERMLQECVYRAVASQWTYAWQYFRSLSFIKERVYATCVLACEPISTFGTGDLSSRSVMWPYVIWGHPTSYLIPYSM